MDYVPSQQPSGLIPEHQHMERVSLTAASQELSWSKLTALGLPNKPESIAAFFQAIAEHNIDLDIILQGPSGRRDAQIDLDTVDISVTVLKKVAEKAEQVARLAVEKLGGRSLERNDDISVISIEGVGMRRNAVILATLYQCLHDLEVTILLLQTMERKITCVVPESEGDRTLEALRATFQEYFQVH